MIRLLGWIGIFKKPKIDTTPEQFNTWLEHHIGKNLQGGNSYYAIGIVGENFIPEIGKDFILYGDFQKADERRRSLQRQNPSIKLELRHVRAYYSLGGK